MQCGYSSSCKALVLRALRLGVFVSSLAVAAADTEYGSRHWQMEEGLPDNVVQAISQTMDGYLWVGTRDGLARFDGIRFTSIENVGETRLRSVTTLYGSDDGSLWIGTENAGLFRVHRDATTRFTTEDGLPSNSVRAIQDGGDGTMWILSSAGLAQYRNGRISVPQDKGVRGYGWSLCRDLDGSLWIATGNGLKRFTENGVSTYTTANGLYANSVRSVHQTRNGDLWIGFKGGVTRMRSGQFTHYPKGDAPSAIVSVIREARDGQIWFGTYDGLHRLSDGRITAERKEDETSYPVYALFEDREGNIWTGGEEGLSCLRPRFFKTHTRQEGLTHNRTMSVREGRDGSIWIGTWGGGLNQLKDGKFTAYTRTNGLASDFVYSVGEGRDGSLWIGFDYGAGLDRLKDGRITHFARSKGLINATVTVIHEDGEESLWIGTQSGLYRMRDGKITRYGTQDGLSAPQINALCERKDGGIWVATANGINYWSEGHFGGPGTNDRPGEAVLSLHEETDGVLWMGTQGKGLKRFKGGKTDTFSIREGLASDAIHSILPDDRNNLWMSTSRGICAVNKESLDRVAAGKSKSVTCATYGRADGILSGGQYSYVMQPAAWKGGDGRLWFRTTQGVVVVDPNRVAGNTIPPPVAIEKIIADRRPVFGGPPMPTKASGARSEASSRVTIPPGRGELEFHYAALSFQSPEKNRFKYRLDDVDPDWVDADTRHAAYYNNIGPGQYRFHVIGCNNDGVWNETGAVISFVLQPHFWQTGWFVSGCGLAATGLFGGAVRFLTRRKMQREVERLERQHALERERSRIAQDLHDDLGASVTQINFLGALAAKEGANPGQVREDIGRIREKAREMAGALDEIVWAVNPKNDSLAGLAHYLCHSAEDFFRGSTISCRLDVAESLPAKALTTEARHNLFLAVREALNNCAKHSGATEVWMRIGMRDGVLRVSIEDNGIGLGQPAQDSGDGLSNMRTRLASIGGQLEFENPAAGGTQVRFILPLG